MRGGVAYRPAHQNRPWRQSGVFVVLFPFLVIALFGLIGLTLTSGNTFADRSKLQNLLDAVAIAAATQVNMMNARKLPDSDDKCSAPHVDTPGNSILGVERAVGNAFGLATAAGPNQSLRTAINRDRDLIIEYATSLNPAAFSADCPETDPAQPIYVRIRLNRRVDTADFLTGIIEPWLGGESYDMRISGSAVAGPAPAAPIWDASQCPAPLFLCDRSDPGTDPDHPPTEACRAAPNGPDCSFGYPKHVACYLTDFSGPVPPCMIGAVSSPPPPSWPTPMHARFLAVPDGVALGDALAGRACPALPDPDERLTVSADIDPADLKEDFSDRWRNKAPATSVTTVVPVVECTQGGTSRSVRGYVCVDLNTDAGAYQDLVGKIIDAGSVQGICGASTVTGRFASRPREPGLVPPLWRIVLYKYSGASDS